MSDSVPNPANRSAWRGGVYRLGAEPPDDLRAITTAEERLEILDVLTKRAWSLTGAPFPDYRRENIPARVVRPS